MFQDLPYLVHGIEIVLVAPDLVGASSLAMNIRLNDLR
jgi:hypothetical protein